VTVANFHITSSFLFLKKEKFFSPLFPVEWHAVGSENSKTLFSVHSTSIQVDLNCEYVEVLLYEVMHSTMGLRFVLFFPYLVVVFVQNVCWITDF
jgi:hypothetical protein